MRDIINVKPESSYARIAALYFNDKIQASQFVVELYDDYLECPLAAMNVFGIKTCLKIVEFCRQN